VFRAFDTNGDGSIDKGEFQAVLKTLGVEISDASFDEAFVALDLDKDGTITLGEFKQVRFASLRLLSRIVLYHTRFSGLTCPAPSLFSGYFF
jgi:hypothetical protein